MSNANLDAARHLSETEPRLAYSMIGPCFFVCGTFSWHSIAFSSGANDADAEAVDPSALMVRLVAIKDEWECLWSGSPKRNDCKLAWNVNLCQWEVRIGSVISRDDTSEKALRTVIAHFADRLAKMRNSPSPEDMWRRAVWAEALAVAYDLLGGNFDADWQNSTAPKELV